MSKPGIGVIGLKVMGSNLARNIESRGFQVAVFNRDGTTTDKFMQENAGKAFTASKSLLDFVQSMQAPRQIILMIQAGAPVDQVMESLLPIISRGDTLIDGGNSYFKDTQRREKRCKEFGVNFIGCGISGGEEGALKGPSMMPGGPKEAWKQIAPLLGKISAYADGACTTYIGPDGAGHFVKMVHNGIEYGDMQLIAEAYQLLKDGIGASPEKLHGIFSDWNKGPLSSFLIEISEKIFMRKDDDSPGFLVDKILDKAGQKGTGKWTAIEALDLGVAIPTLAAAVDARVLSSMKEERVSASASFSKNTAQGSKVDEKTFVSMVHGALYCSKIMAYAQGMALLAAASTHYNWDLKLGEIAAIWKGGCIIRARFLDEIRKAYVQNPSLPNLILEPGMKKALEENIGNLRKIVAIASERGIPVPAFAASLSYFDAYTSANLPQNLTQAQRDFFGAHTYERKDKPGIFHSRWE